MVNYSGGGDVYSARLGLAAQSFPVEVVNNTNLGATSGAVIYQLIRPVSSKISALGLWLGAAGGTSTGYSGMGLYSEAGVLLASTPDMTTALTTAGNADKTVEGVLAAPYTASTAQNYYLALLCQLTSQPTIAGQDTNSGQQIPDPLNGHRVSLNQTGQTALPATFNPATAGVPAASYWFYAR